LSDYGPEIDKMMTVVPYIRQLYGDEVSFAVSTVDHYLYYEKGKNMDLGIRPGDPVKAGGIAENAIRTGRRVIIRAPGSLYGVPYIGTGVPILEDGRVVGSLALGRPVHIEEKLQEMAQKMSSSVESVSSGSSGFAASAEELAATSAELANNTERIRDDVKDMDAIISLPHKPISWV